PPMRRLGTQVGRLVPPTWARKQLGPSLRGLRRAEEEEAEEEEAEEEEEQEEHRTARGVRPNLRIYSSVAVPSARGKKEHLSQSLSSQSPTLAQDEDEDDKDDEQSGTERLEKQEGPTTVCTTMRREPRTSQRGALAARPV
ncbi:unnamed protein product, partial [Prorocentrum cordatum]